MEMTETHRSKPMVIALNREIFLFLTYLDNIKES